MRIFFFCSYIIAFEFFAVNSPYYKREYLSSAINVLTNSPKNSHITDRDIFQLNLYQNDKNMVKVLLSCRFEMLFGLFTLLTLKGCSEARRFKHF